VNLKGPELKLSELKVPAVLRDLYCDLRDRRLLPLVGLILVAIVATPFLLGGGSKSHQQIQSPQIGGVAHAASLTVLPADPGLREPGKRLAGRKPENPFIQKYSGPVLNEGSAPVEESVGAQGGADPGETVVEGSAGGSSPAPAPESAPSESGGDGGSSQPTPSPDQIQLYSFAVDLKIAHAETTSSGGKKMGTPEIREEVLPTTALPGKKSPALTYLGVDPKSAKKALFLVSPEVESLLGDGKCVSGTSICQLLALDPDVPEVVEYGPNGVRYKIEVLRIFPVISGHASGKGQ
jgi:hypothetical protein